MSVLLFKSVLAKEGITWSVSVVEKISTETLLISADHLLKTACLRNWELRGDQEISETMYLMYINEGCDQDNGCSTRDPLLDLHQRTSGLGARERLRFRHLLLLLLFEI